MSAMSKCPISVSYLTGAQILIKALLVLPISSLTTDLKEDAWLNLDGKRRKASENATEVCVSVYVCLCVRERVSHSIHLWCGNLHKNLSFSIFLHTDLKIAPLYTPEGTTGWMGWFAIWTFYAKRYWDVLFNF